MLRLKNWIVLFLIAGALWHFYGETYEHSGFQGVFYEIKEDVNELIENPAVTSTVNTIKQEFQILMARMTEFQENNDMKTAPILEKPKLNEPTNQTFSIHNIEIGDTRSNVEAQVGSPKRSSINEYGVEWSSYHENYQNFFMVAYDNQDKVAGLYTNQDLLSSTLEIDLETSRETVLSSLDEPLSAIRKGLVRYQIQNDEENDTFFIDHNYVTIFYDKHENSTVTAIQIISAELEQQKKEYFGKPTPDLKDGLEYQLFDLTNATRVVHGLPTLSWEESLRKTARNHSKDMADHNYFSHHNLEGQSPFDRMKEDDIVFRIAGENLATGQPSSIFAHEGLMNSQGHRENILKKEFESLAVGVAFNQNSQPFYTENFLTK
ncbi:CAP domain-containing protein [Oceanobacillus sp. Castelsardo]|uniref:CAP domain-containing protein n=1 Tax=Oceanobacillus sp. Castelsardo TaxID=1851204 RepID=UPI0008398352|nr:CAP domain-containing protein [Oceanobacillus sp. Castelsardo]